MLLDNEVEVGERLHDAKLAEALGVSRTPVREAVKLLATEGLVDLMLGRGARVAAYRLRPRSPWSKSSLAWSAMLASSQPF